MTIKVKKTDVIVNVDEHPKPKTTLETLAKLPTVFKKDGVVTAGSASVSTYMSQIVYILIFNVDLLKIYLNGSIQSIII